MVFQGLSLLVLQQAFSSNFWNTVPNLQFCTVQRDFILPSGQSVFPSYSVNTNLLLIYVAAQTLTISIFISRQVFFSVLVTSNHCERYRKLF